MTLEEIAELLGTFEGTEEAVTALGEFRRVSEGANARISELENALAELENKYTATAARNYELMTAATAAADVVEDDEEAATEADDDGDIYDLFEERA